jgi:4-amino-4-deoxy-L-arabinose transferase-like glycosyltransferase
LGDQLPSIPHKTTRKQKTLLLISAALALLSHAIFMIGLPGTFQQNQSTDYAIYYEPVAQKLATGGGFFLASRPALRYPPGIPVLYAGTFWISEQLHISRGVGLRALEAILLTGSSILVALTANLVFGWRAALIASALWSTYPFHLWLTKQPDPTSGFSLLLLSSVFLLLLWARDGKHPARYGCGVGCTLAVAALIKPIVIVLPFVVAGLSWFCIVPCRRRQRALFSACVVAAYLLLISPWELWARQISGDWIPLCTNGPSVLIDGLTFGTVRGLQPVAMPARVSAFTKEAVEREKELRNPGNMAHFLAAKTRQEPGTVAEFFLIKAVRSWYGNESHTVEKWVLVIQLLYLPFVVAGARMTIQGAPEPRNFFLLASTFVLYFWAMTTFTALPLLRYMVPTVGFLMILAAPSVEVLLFYLRGYRRHPAEELETSF